MQVLYFAWLRERIGLSREQVETDAATVADLVLVAMDQEWTVAHKNIYYKCGWSPFEGETFHSKVTHTWVNGKLVYKDGLFNEMIRGERLEFEIGDG